MGTKWKDELLVWNPQQSDDLLRIWLRFVQENVEAGYNADGRRLPPGVDIYETGDLLYLRVTITGGRLTFPVDYAEIVEAKYHFAGIPPNRWNAFLTEIKPFMIRGLSNRPR
jgi:hypothetical protein